MPAELAESLQKSGAVPTVPPPKNAAPGEHVDGWSDSLVGWIPEESSRIDAMPEEEAGQERSTSSLVLVAVIAALVVGGGGIAAVVMFSGDDAPPPVATTNKAPPPPEPEPAPPVAAAPEPEPEPEPEAELVLDEDDLVLEDIEDEPEAPAPAAPTKAKKRGSRGPAKDVGPAPSGPVVQLSASMVRREIAQNMFHVHRCYDAALKRDPTLEGRYSVTITIGRNGRVSRASIDRDSLGHPGVADCVKRKLMAWRFPIKGQLSDPTEVSFPVTFKR